MLGVNFTKEALMRKIIVLEFMSLDGVIQGGGGPEEDTSGGFTLGGWCVPFTDDVTNAAMMEQMGHPFDLLLGRKTFDIWEPYWPAQPESEVSNPINAATKYVASNTRNNSDWDKTVFLSGDVAAKIQEIRQIPGPDLQVYGSADFVQTLLENDLVDELWLKIYPVILGGGKRLFQTNTASSAWTLTESKTSPSGVIIASYKRAGEVETGSF